jgi:autotransporter translocation and assembly factor TamB
MAPRSFTLTIVKIIPVIAATFVILALLLWSILRVPLVRWGISDINKSMNGTLQVDRITFPYGTIVLHEPLLTLRDGTSVCRAKELSIRYSVKDLLIHRSFVGMVKDITLTAPHLSVIIDEKGKMNLSRLIEPQAKKLDIVPLLKKFSGSAIIKEGEIVYLDADKKTFRPSFAHVDCSLIPQEQGDFSVTLDALVKGTPLSSSLSGRGTVNFSSPHVAINIKGHEMEGSSWGNYLLRQTIMEVTKGSGDFTLTIRGASSALESLPSGIFLWGSLDLRDGEVFLRPLGSAFTDIDGHVEFNENYAQIERGRARLGGSQLELSGQIFGFKDPSLDFDIAFKDFDIAPLSHLKGIKGIPRLKGKLSGALHLGGDPQFPIIEGRLSLPRGSVDGRSFEDVALEGRYTTAGIKITSMHSTMGGGQYSGHGWVFPQSEHLLLDISGHDAPFTFDAGKGGTVAGKTRFKVNLLGTFKNPTIVGQAWSDNLTLAGEHYDAGTAAFLMQGPTIILKKGLIGKNGGLFSASGIVDMADRRFDLFLEASSFPLPQAGPLIGAVSCTANLFGTTNAPMFYGIVGSQKFQYGDLALENLTIPLKSDGSFVSLAPSSAIWKGSPVRFSGGMALGREPYLEMAVITDRLSLSNLPAAGSLSLRGNGMGEARISGGPSVGYLCRGNALIDGGKVFGSAWLGSSKKWVACLSSSKVPLKTLVYEGKSPAEGILDEGEALLMGNGRNMTLDCSASFLGSKIVGFPLSTLYGSLSYAPPMVMFTSADLRGVAGRLSLAGSMDTRAGTYKFSTDSAALDVGYLAKNLDFAMVSPTLGVSMRSLMGKEPWPSIEGLARFNGTLSGDMKSPRFEGVIALDEGLYRNEILAFQTQVSALPQSAFFRNLSLRMGRSTFTGFGEVAYRPDLSFDFSVTSSRGDVGKLIAFSPWKDMAVTGDLDGDFRVRGKPADLLIDGSMILTRASFNGQPVKEMRATFRSKDSDLSIENMVVQLSSGQVEGSGKITKGGGIELSLKGADFPLGEIESLRTSLGKVDGKADFDIIIGGTRAAPEVKLNFKARDIDAGSLHFDSSEGSVAWKEGRLSFDSLILRSGEGSYDLRGLVEFPDKKIPLSKEAWLVAQEGKALPLFDIAAEVKKGRSDILLKLLSEELEKNIKGTIDGRFSLKGNLKDPSLDVDVVLREGRLRDIPLISALSKVRYDNHRYQSVHIDLATKDSSVSLNGELNATEGNDVSIVASNLDLATFSFLLPHKFDLGGIIDVNARLSGDLHLPDLISDLKIKNGHVGGFNFDGLQGKIMATKGILSLKDFYILEKGSRIALNGTVPLMFADNRMVTTAPLEIKADLKEDDLDLFSLIIPLEGKTQGTLLGTMGVYGMYPDIMVEGFLSIKDGELQPRILKKPITNITTLVQFFDSKVAIKNLEGRMGQGHFAIGGEIDFSNSALKNVDLKVAGKDLAVFAQEYFSGIADIEGTLKGDGSQQVLTGKIATRNATFHIPTSDLTRDPEESEHLIKKFKESLPGGVRNIFAKVDLELGNDTWLTFLSSSLLTRGSLSVVGQVPEVALVGEVDLYRGTFNIPLLETPFKVYQGKAYFDGQGWSPYLALNAEATIGQYQITMDMTGKVDNPRIELTSEPPLRQDAIERMVSGNPMATSLSAGAVQTDLMATRLAERLLDVNLVQPLFQAIGRTFSLSDVSLEYSYGKTYTMRIAKALDPKERLLLTYERIMGNFGEIDRLWGLEYRYKRGMLIRISQNDQGNSYIWLQGRYGF